MTQPTPETTPPSTGRVGKRAELRARRRRQQRRLTALLLGVVLLVVAVVVVVLATGGDDDAKKRAAPKRTQQTLLLQVKGKTGDAVGSALLAHDPATSSGSVVLVPPQVLANVAGGGNLPFGRALRTSTVTGSRNALADLMGVTIDGSWVLDSVTFSRLIDQVGGVQVTVNATVIVGRVVLLQPGAQRLSGERALDYATYLATDEQEQTRLTRLQAVLDGLLNALPKKDLETSVRALGGGSELTVPPARLVSLLQGLRADDDAEALQYRTLPVIPIETGDEARFRIDATKTVALVDELLAQSIPAGARAQGNRVLVLNGVGTPGLGQQVRDKIVPAGFVFVASRNAQTFDHATTEIYVSAEIPEAAVVGRRLAQVLGVPVTSVQGSTQIGTIADVIVVVGADFKAK